MSKVTIGLWRNLKTGKLYLVDRIDVINATNAQSGERMVLYRPFQVSDDAFVREESEFLVKFKREETP